MKQLMVYDWCRCLGDYDPSRPYEDFIIAQSALVHQRLEGKLSTDILIVTAHPPTISLGASSLRQQIPHIRGLPEHIRNSTLPDDELFLAAKTYLEKNYHINLIKPKKNRGGSVWYHDHGVLQLYLIARINPEEITDIICPLEEVLIRTLAELGIAATRAKKEIRRSHNSFIGLWVKNKKIAAFGVRLERNDKHADKEYVSMFGASLNIKQCRVNSALIDPCGITGAEMTSIAQELNNGFGVPHSCIMPIIHKNLRDIFQTEIIEKKFKPWETVLIKKSVG